MRFPSSPRTNQVHLFVSRHSFTVAVRQFGSTGLSFVSCAWSSNSVTSQASPISCITHICRVQVASQHSPLRAIHLRGISLVTTHFRSRMARHYLSQSHIAHHPVAHRVAHITHHTRTSRTSSIPAAYRVPSSRTSRISPITAHIAHHPVAHRTYHPSQPHIAHIIYPGQHIACHPVAHRAYHLSQRTLRIIQSHIAAYHPSQPHIAYIIYPGRISRAI